MRLASFALVGSLIVLGTSCGKDGTKLAECNALVTVIGDEDKKLAGPDPVSADAMVALANKLDAAAAAVAGVSVTKPELVTQRDAVQKAWTQAAAAVRLAMEAAEKADVARAAKAQEDSSSAGRRYEEAVTAVNRYCHE